MNRSPILKALSAISNTGARTLLIGGQACVFYGALEFSNDLDLLVGVDTDDLERVQAGLADLLEAESAHVRYRSPALASEP